MILFFVDYIITFIITMFSGKKNRRITLLLFIIFVMLFSFRDISKTVSDIDEYRFFYENYENKSVAGRFAFEPGYDLANKVFRFLRLPFECFMVFLGVFYSLIFWKYSKRYTARLNMVALMPALYFMFYYSMESLRQSISQIIAYYAYYFLVSEGESRRFVLSIGRKEIVLRNEEFKYYIFSLIAFLFHRTAIMLFIIPLFNKRTWKILIAGFIILLNIFLPYIESTILIRIPYLYVKYMAYKIDDGLAIMDWGNILSFRLMEYILVIIVLLLMKDKNKLEKLTLSLAEIGVLIQAFLSFCIGATYRLLQYTDVIFIFFVVSICERSRKPMERYVFLIVVSGWTFLRFYRLFSTNEDLHISYGLIGLG